MADFRDLLRRKTVLEIAARLAVNSGHGTDGSAVLKNIARHLEIRQAERLHARIVSTVQFPVHHETDTETCTECVADKVMETLVASCLGKPCIDLRKRSAESLAISIEVTIIVYIYRNAELVLKERSESHSVTERREVRKIATDNAVRIVSRPRKRETDRHRLLLKLLDYSAEPEHESLQTEVQVLRIGRKIDRINDIFASAHCAEYHIGTAGVEREDYT